MNPIRSAAAACALLLSFAVPAQAVPVSLVGAIEKAPSSPCNAMATHRIACTDVLLYSTKVDLTQLEGKTQAIRGALQAQPGCVAIEVETAENAAQRTSTLALFGFRLGRPVVFTTTAPAGAVVSYFFGFGPGFVPLGDFGSLLIDPIGAVYWTSDLSIGIAIRSVTIPNDPNLVGLEMFMQTTWLQITPTLGGGLINPTCFKIAQ